MKRIILLAAVLLAAFSAKAADVSQAVQTTAQTSVASARTSLINSPRNSEYVSVYKLDHDQLISLFGPKPKPISEKYLTDYQTKYRSDKPMPVLPRGNYVLIKAVGGKLNYTSHTVDDFGYSVLPGHRLVIALYNQNGDNIGDARIKMFEGGGRFRYDKKTRTYTANMPNEPTTVEIDNAGVYHYLTVDNLPRHFDRYYDSAEYSLAERRKLSKEEKRSEKRALTGMLVFSKPKYKPGETVKFKAYVTDTNRKPFDGVLQVRLKSDGWRGESLDTLLAELKPYRAGGYEYEFKLTDSLGVKLDTRYKIEFTDKTDSEREIDIRGGFQYEDYELKGTTFNVRMGKRTYYAGEEVDLYMKASDINGMAQLDGRVEVTLRLQSHDLKLDGNTAYVEHQSWTHQMPLDRPGEQKLVIPDSVFSAGVSAGYSIDAKWYSADNETHRYYDSFTRKSGNERILFTESVNTLRIVKLSGDDTVRTDAKITYYTADGEVIGFENVALPASVSPGRMAYNIKVETPKESENYNLSEYHNLNNDVSFSPLGGGVRLEVNNPRGYGFVYRIWKGNRLIERGYSTEPKFTLDQKGNAKSSHTARVDILKPYGYTSITRAVNRSRHELNLAVETPLTVYPGQKADVDLNVTDWKGRAVSGADLTAFAYTSKFGNGNIVMPYWRKEERASVTLSYPYKFVKELDNVLAKIEWDRWQKELGLADNEYYQFLNPQPVNLFIEESRERRTQISPYVVVDGVVQGAQIIWINDIPVYFRGADKTQPYAFYVEKNKLYTIVVRTADRMVRLAGFIPVAEKHNILSMNGDMNLYETEQAKSSGSPEEKSEGYTVGLIAQYKDLKTNNTRYGRVSKNIESGVIKNASMDQRKLLESISRASAGDGYVKVYSVWDKDVKKDTLSQLEYNLLSSNLIGIERNFGGRYLADIVGRQGIYKSTAVVKNGKGYYLPAKPERSYRGWSGQTTNDEFFLIGPSVNSGSTNILVDGKLEGSYNLTNGTQYRLAPNGVETKPIDESVLPRALEPYTIEQPDFMQYVLTPARVDSLYLNEILQYLSDRRRWSFIEQNASDSLLSYSIPRFFIEQGKLSTAVNMLEQTPKGTYRYNVRILSKRDSEPAFVKVEPVGADSRALTQRRSRLPEDLKFYSEKPEDMFRITLFFKDWTYASQDVKLYSGVGSVNYINFETAKHIEDTVGIIRSELNYLLENHFFTVSAPRLGYRNEPGGEVYDKVGKVYRSNLDKKVVTGHLLSLSEKVNFKDTVYVEFEGQRQMLTDSVRSFELSYSDKSKGYLSFFMNTPRDSNHEIAKVEFEPGFNYILQIGSRNRYGFRPDETYWGNSFVLFEPSSEMVYTGSIPSTTAREVYNTMSKNGVIENISAQSHAVRSSRSRSAEMIPEAIFERAPLTITGSLQQILPRSMANRDYDPYEEGGNLMGEDTEAEAGAGGLNVASMLVIVNGLPYTGNVDDISMAEVVSMNVIKPPRSVDIYGAQGQNGVVVITTRTVVSDDEPGMSLRTNFSDEAFWQPKLMTDKNGKVSFEITYPDDITSWNANFVAAGKGYDMVRKELTIRSFKALNGQISLPRFAIQGDRFDAIGRVSNYLGDTTRVLREAYVGETQILSDSLTVAESYSDKVNVSVGAEDSLAVKYTISNVSIFDGEQRKIPVYRQGTLQTDGVFMVLNTDSTYTFGFEGDGGGVTVNMETSSLETFMREIQKIDDYEYLCNEQMASKIKALIAKRRVSRTLGLVFEEDQKITELLEKLGKSVNPEGLWGWWNNDGTQMWISQQIIEAMLMAQREGFSTPLNRSSLVWYMASATLGYDTDRGGRRVANRESVQQYCRKVILLKQLDPQYDIKVLADRLDDVRIEGLNEKLLAMRVKQLAGELVQLDSLMKWSQRTMLGGLYWGRQRRMGIMPVYRYMPYDGEPQSTLLAYEILRDQGGKEKELGEIRNYFFEIRKGGSWSNTYESSNIIQTILPDMLKEGEQYSNARVRLNGVEVDSLPHKTVLSDVSTVEVSKSGTTPVFFTAYQQSWNPEPEARNEGFSVTTSFDDGVTLKAGEAVDLEVVVDASSSADYVMIEVPIPAGCSYDSKNQAWWSREVHREHHKERVSIFCSSLPEGETKFRIRLLPRFTGEYHVNPARAELMYFPTFYGREGMKHVNIGE